MKKLTLLLISGAFAFGASAQNSTIKSMVSVNPVKNSAQSVDKTVDLEKMIEARKAVIANKGTVHLERWYNYVDYLYLINNTIENNNYFPYSWFEANSLAIYSGPVLDTISFTSEAMVLHPQATVFNDAAAFAGELEIASDKGYKLDSVIFYGAYGRNPAKASVVDTAIITATYGNGGTSNVGIYGYENFNGVDTARGGTLYWDSVKNHAAANGGGLTNVIVKKIPLTVASLNDTTADGLNFFAAEFNMNIPAGNLVGASFTFKSGDTYTPGDTVFAGSVTPTRPFKYNMVRPLIYEVSDGQFMPYTKTPINYNMGDFKFWPNSANYPDSYIPALAFIEATFPYEYPYVSFKLSCEDCNRVGINDVNNHKVSAFAAPNPANNGTVKINFSSEVNGNADLTITNTIGQKVYTQNLGNVIANQGQSVEVNTSTLASGIYFFTINVDGSSKTDRFVINN